ncbi:MAG: HAMP domain-containing protein [Verrucomicrobia bacterium]|nr:HAMP domain-containing protein [Verrucomicrobiota bacterium]
MKLRRLLSVLFIIFASLLLVLMVLTIKTRARAFELIAAVNQRFESYQLADEVRQSSDDLTRMARTFVITGDPKYEKFFERILAIREGTGPRPKTYNEVYWDLITTPNEPPLGPDEKPSSLESRMLEAGFTVEEFSLLQNAHVQSDQLAQIESNAIHALKGEFDDGTGTFPIKKAPNQALAIEILHNQKFHETKAQIMGFIRDFMRKVNQRTENRTRQLEMEMTWDLKIGLFLVSLLLVLFVAGFMVILHRVLRPVHALERAVDELGRHDYHPITISGGVREFSRLLEAFHRMASQLQDHDRERSRVLEQLKEKTVALEQEKRKAEELLLNVLPATIVSRLQKGEKVEAETFSEVTVLFADVVGFTQLSAQEGPRSVANLLNELFEFLDGLAEKYHLEKIKTIGDCYMAVAGVPTRNPTHTQQMADFALEAIQTLLSESPRFSKKIQIRVGMHSGTVAAGIIGRKKFAYDLWGDVVNVTSRLEATSEPMKIHVSDSVHARLEDDYLFEERGEVELRHRGRMKTFYLIGKKTA